MHISKNKLLIIPLILLAPFFLSSQIKFVSSIKGTFDFDGDGLSEFLSVEKSDPTSKHGTLCSYNEISETGEHILLWSYNSATPVRDITIADMNGDSSPEIVVLSRGGLRRTIEPWLRIFSWVDGIPSSEASASWGAASRPTNLAIVDLDNNGWDEIAISMGSPARGITLLSMGENGVIEKQQSLAPGSLEVGMGLLVVSPSDYNNDGLIDLVAISEEINDLHIQFYLNDGGLLKIDYSTTTAIQDNDLKGKIIPAAISQIDSNFDGVKEILLPHTSAKILLVELSSGGKVELQEMDPQGISLFNFPDTGLEADDMNKILLARAEAGVTQIKARKIQSRAIESGTKTLSSSEGASTTGRRVQKLQKKIVRRTGDPGNDEISSAPGDDEKKSKVDDTSEKIRAETVSEDSNTKPAEEATEETDDAIDIEKEVEKRLETKKSAKKAEIDAAASLKSAEKEQAKTVLAAKEEVDIQQEIVNSITAKEDIEDITNKDKAMMQQAIKDRDKAKAVIDGANKKAKEEALAAAEQASAKADGEHDIAIQSQADTKPAKEPTEETDNAKLANDIEKTSAAEPELTEKASEDSDTKSAEESTEKTDDAILTNDIEKTGGAGAQPTGETVYNPKDLVKVRQLQLVEAKEQAKTVVPAAKEEVDTQQAIIDSITAKENIEDRTKEDKALMKQAIKDRDRAKSAIDAANKKVKEAEEALAKVRQLQLVEAKTEEIAHRNVQKITARKSKRKETSGQLPEDKLPEGKTLTDTVYVGDEVLTAVLNETAQQLRNFSPDYLPDGAKFDPVKRVIDWTPKEGQLGIRKMSYTVSFAVQDEVEVEEIRGQSVTARSKQEEKTVELYFFVAKRKDESGSLK